jgi:ArsR family transcriptional regulator, lead/cadmium/zinc/bismuth-responsive transcriptional repressor
LKDVSREFTGETLLTKRIYMAVLSTKVQTNKARTAGTDVCQERIIHAEQVLAVRHAKLGTEQAAQVADLFAVLSDPTRLQVLYAFLQAPGGELCVCDLATGLGRDDTTISHQLRVLRNQRIVAMRKVGRIVYYRLVDDHIRQLLELGMTHTNEIPANLSHIKEIEVSA